MKLNCYVFQKSKLIKLQFLKFKFYKFKQNDIDKNLEYTELCLKKAVKVIHSYHLHNKTILFVGLSKKIQKDCLKVVDKTKHLVIPEKTWIKGMLSNQSAVYKDKKKKISLPSMKKTPDLVILLDKEIEPIAFHEAINLQIPVIAITSDVLFNKNKFYSIVSNVQTTIRNNLSNLFFLLISSTLKR